MEFGPMKPGFPRDPEILNDRAVDLMTRYRQRRRIADLENAVGHFRAALAVSPVYAADARSGIFGNLSAALRELYERTRNAELLAEAEAVGRESLKPHGSADPMRLIKLGTLAAVLHTRYEIDSEPDILEEEIGLLEEAVRLARPDHPYLGGYLSNLTHALYTRLSGPLGPDADPDAPSARLVEHAREAVPLLPPDDRGRAHAVLAMALRTRAEVTNELVFLWEAADQARAAVAETPPGHVARAGVLSNSAAVLRALQEHTGNLGPLHEAVALLREAARSSQPDEHNRAIYLSNLANALRDLSSVTGQTAPLADAMQALQEAVALCEPGGIRRGSILSTLVQVSLDLAERAGDPGLLAVAESAARAAVDSTPEGHREEGLRLSNLAHVLTLRGRRAEDEPGAEALLRAAAETARRAVGARGEPAARAKATTNLAAVLQELGERTGNLSTLREAVEAARAAHAELATAPGHPFALQCQANLAPVYWALGRFASDDERLTAFTESLRIHRAVADSVEAPSSLRIRCHRAAAAVLRTFPGGPRPTEALEAIEAAVELLPQTVVADLPRADREFAAGRLAGLAAQAAAVAVAAGRPERAVELAEYSRGLLVAEALDARGGHFARARRTPEARESVERLEALDRRLAVFEQHADLAVGQVEPERVGRGELSRTEAETATRRELQAERALLVRAIRGIEGLEGFLSPPDFASLAEAAEGGYLVYVYADTERCDALAVSSGPDPAVRVIPLSDATPDALAACAQAVNDGLASARDPESGRAAVDAAENAVLEQLAWTWDVIAEPILNSLGLAGAPQGAAPRIWWCPIGIASQLPLHAAGHHAAGADRSVFDRVAASYVPSARALLNARSVGADAATAEDPGGANGASRANGDRPGPLVVSVPEIEGSGFARLEGAEAEAEMIERLCENAQVLETPSRKAVLRALSAHRVAHFACHGEGDAVDPGRGRLILPDHDTAPLTVGEISRLTLRDAELAYLSACETTVTSLRLADESVHMTAAFHLAGYRRVVGTLWVANDAIAYDIAELFYERITAGGREAPDVTASAHALREALLEVRERLDHRRTPSLWAGYVHYGA
jgi:tetratricopeptide (TPR) repeat protein